MAGAVRIRIFKEGRWWRIQSITHPSMTFHVCSDFQGVIERIKVIERLEKDWEDYKQKAEVGV